MELFSDIEIPEDLKAMTGGDDIKVFIIPAWFTGGVDLQMGATIRTDIHFSIFQLHKIIEDLSTVGAGYQTFF